MPLSALRALGVLALLVTTCAGGLAAQTDLKSPVGTWRTIDDRTGQPRSVVRIYEQDGKLFGQIVRSLKEGEDPNATCVKCTDERKGQPFVGMIFMRNLKLVDGEYTDGDILDPDNGSVYRCKMRLEDGGKKLVVRGFRGISLFGRAQTWEREP
jgi:uncharacterized protein (DUF2147 family)